MKYHVTISSNHKCGMEEQNMKKDKNLAGRLRYSIDRDSKNLMQ